MTLHERHSALIKVKYNTIFDYAKVKKRTVKKMVDAKKAPAHLRPEINLEII